MDYELLKQHALGLEHNLFQSLIKPAWYRQERTPIYGVFGVAGSGVHALASYIATSHFYLGREHTIGFYSRFGEDTGLGPFQFRGSVLTGFKNIDQAISMSDVLILNLSLVPYENQIETMEKIFISRIKGVIITGQLKRDGEMTSTAGMIKTVQMCDKIFEPALHADQPMIQMLKCRYLEYKPTFYMIPEKLVSILESNK